MRHGAPIRTRRVNCCRKRSKLGGLFIKVGNGRGVAHGYKGDMKPGQSRVCGDEVSVSRPLFVDTILATVGNLTPDRRVI